MNKPRLRNSFLRSFLSIKTLALTPMIAWLFIPLSALQLHAKDSLPEEKISLVREVAPIKEILKEIEKQTEFRFFYNHQHVDVKRSIYVNVNEVTLIEALDEIFKNVPIGYSISGRQILLFKINKSAGGQELLNKTFIENIPREPALVTVSGTVRSATGESMPGVNVIQKGTTNGTTTDVNGRYNLSFSEGDAVLVFSFIGYTTQEVTVSGRSVVDVVLAEDVQSLQEVVVVGYTTKQLSQLSSSVSVVSGEELNDVTSNNITSLLQGKSPGVIVSGSGHPNASPSIVIRGSGSITAGSAPLYVVDGVIGGKANPQDVESVTILKDAAATGLYGSRASNGVIIITTKRGKPGKTQIQFSSTMGFNTKTTGRFEVMNSQQLYDYQKSFMTPEDFDRVRPGSLLQQNTDWINLAFRTGVTQDYSLSLSTGSEKTQLYTSANYFKEEGTLRHTGNEAYNVRSNISHHINDKLQMIIQFNGDFGKFENEASGAGGALYGAFINIPWDNPYNPDGTVKMGTEPGWIGRENNNFLQGWEYNFNWTKHAAMTGDFNLIYTIGPNLNFSTYNRASYNNSKNILYYDVRSKPGLASNGALDNSFSNGSQLITSNRLQYEKNFGSHSLSAIAVAEVEKNYSDNNSINGQGLPAGLAVMDVASTILSADGNTGENAFSKGLVQVDYNYNNRYFAVGSFINESSSRFGANNRSANFYTLAASWILSNEPFMEDLNLFDLLKVRASYGSTGNAQIGNYQSLGLYNYSYQYAGFSASAPSQLANDNLTWEKAKTMNFGLDIGMFKQISLNIDLYDKTTNALLLNAPLPYTSGFSSIIANIGSVRNKGLEVNLNTINLTGGLRWETNFNIAFNRNRVLELYQDKDIITGNQSISVGRDLNSWYMRKWAGVDPATGDPLWEKLTTDANGNTLVTTTNSYSEATQQFVDVASPNFTGGIMNSFAYKNFSLNAFFNFVSGNQVYHNTREFFDSDGSYQTFNTMLLIGGWKRWEQPGDIATHPRSVTGGNKLSNKPSSRYLEDGSYLRLRNISLAYQLPGSLLSRIGIANMKIFVSGDNLWTSTRFSGMDPEVVLGPGGGTSGWKYPISKKLLFGLKIKF